MQLGLIGRASEQIKSQCVCDVAGLADSLSSEQSAKGEKRALEDAEKTVEAPDVSHIAHQTELTGAKGHSPDSSKGQWGLMFKLLKCDMA